MLASTSGRHVLWRRWFLHNYHSLSVASQAIMHHRQREQKPRMGLMASPHGPAVNDSINTALQVL